jgi:hypothetical protein
LQNESLILVCFGVLELRQTFLWVRSHYMFMWNFNLQLHSYFLGFKLSFCLYLQSLFSLACIWDNMFTVNINNEFFQFPNAQGRCLISPFFFFLRGKIFITWIQKKSSIRCNQIWLIPCGKKCTKVAKFWGTNFWNHHIKTNQFPTGCQNIARFLKIFYFSLWSIRLLITLLLHTTSDNQLMKKMNWFGEN